jgi:hypothetical protein
MELSFYGIPHINLDKLKDRVLKRLLILIAVTYISILIFVSFLP